MPNWSFARTLQFELGLDQETCERVEDIVASSGHFLTREAHKESLDAVDNEWQQEGDRLNEEIYALEGRIEVLERKLKAARDLLAEKSSV